MKEKCEEIPKPVCGEDNVTYRNECLIKCLHKIKLKSQGSFPTHPENDCLCMVLYDLVWEWMERPTAILGMLPAPRSLSFIKEPAKPKLTADKETDLFAAPMGKPTATNV